MAIRLLNKSVGGLAVLLSAEPADVFGPPVDLIQSLGRQVDSTEFDERRGSVNRGTTGTPQGDVPLSSLQQPSAGVPVSTILVVIVVAIGAALGAFVLAAQRQPIPLASPGGSAAEPSQPAAAPGGEPLSIPDPAPDPVPAPEPEPEPEPGPDPEPEPTPEPEPEPGPDPEPEPTPEPEPEPGPDPEPEPSPEPELEPVVPRWAFCGSADVGSSRQFGHSASGPWVPSGSYLVGLDLDPVPGAAPADSPGVGLVSYCEPANAGAGWGDCGWVAVINSHQAEPSWGRNGTYLVAVDLDRIPNTEVRNSPVIGQALYCELAGSTGWADTYWVQVRDPLSPAGDRWCQDGSYLIQLDQDLVRSGGEHDSPIVGRARCAYPA